MTNQNSIKAVIEKITDTEVFLHIHGQVKSFPRELLVSNKQPGEEIIIRIEDPKSLESESEAHYIAMKRILKELVQ